MHSFNQVDPTISNNDDINAAQPSTRARLNRALLHATGAALTILIAATPACSFASKLGIPGQAKQKKSPNQANSTDRPSGNSTTAKTSPEDLPEPAADSDGDELRRGFVVFDPEHGMAKVASMSPPWCDVAAKSEANAGSISRSLQTFWTPDSLATVGSRLCAHPTDPVYMEQTAHFIQGWMNRSGQNQKDAIASLTARMDIKRWEREQKETCGRYEVSDEANGTEKTEPEAMLKMFGCKGSLKWREGPSQLRNNDQFFIHYDVRVEPANELHRVWAVLDCFGNRTDNKHEYGNYQWKSLATCQFDAQSLNHKTLDAALKKGKHNQFARVVASESIATAALGYKKVKAELNKAIAKEPALKELFVDAPRRGFMAWKKNYSTHKQAFEAAYRMEKLFLGKSRKAMRVCGDAERKGIAGYIAGATITDLESAKRAFGDSVGNVLLGAAYACAAAQKNIAEYLVLKKLYEDGKPARGPRTAATLAAVSALGEILADRPRFSVPTSVFDVSSFSPVREHAADLFIGQSLGPLDPFSGVVATVKAHPQGKVITFKTETYKEDTHVCKDSNKIWKISGGKVHYHRSCRSTGTRTRKRTTPPIIFPDHATAGIKSGVFVEFDGGMAAMSRGKPANGYPKAVYAKPDKKKLLSAYGYKVATK